MHTPIPWFRRLNLRHLELLLELHQQRSLTQAAAALHMTQPAVSQQLAHIEAALGVPLFERGRGLPPTPSGLALLRYAQQVLEGARRVQLEVRALQAGHGGLVRLGAMLVAATVLVPRVVSRLQAEPGSVQLELVEDILQGLWPRLERGELDLVVCRIDARVRASGLPVEALYEDPHVVVCGPRHALTQRQTVTWADTLQHPWVLPPRSTPLRSALESSFNAVGLPPPAADIASASLSATQAILQTADALAVMSRSAALHFQAQALVKALPLELPYDIGPVGVAWLQPDPGPAVSRVLQALREEGRLLARGG